MKLDGAHNTATSNVCAGNEMVGNGSPVLHGDVFRAWQLESHIHFHPQDEAHEIGNNPDEARLARIIDRAEHAALVDRPSGLAEVRFWR